MTDQERKTEIQHNLSLISVICTQLRTDSQRLEECIQRVENEEKPREEVQDFQGFMEYITAPGSGAYNACFGKKTEDIILSETDGEYMVSQLKKFQERLLIVERKLESIGTLVRDQE